MLKMAVAGLILSVGSFANAGLIIDVSNNAGKAEFTFSGTDVFTNDGHLNNGLWLLGIEFSEMFAQPTEELAMTMPL